MSDLRFPFIQSLLCQFSRFCPGNPGEIHLGFVTLLFAVHYQSCMILHFTGFFTRCFLSVEYFLPCRVIAKSLHFDWSFAERRELINGVFLFRNLWQRSILVLTEKSTSCSFLDVPNISRLIIQNFGWVCRSCRKCMHCYLQSCGSWEQPLCLLIFLASLLLLESSRSLLPKAIVNTFSKP